MKPDLADSVAKDVLSHGPQVQALRCGLRSKAHSWEQLVIPSSESL